MRRGPSWNGSRGSTAAARAWASVAGVDRREDVAETLREQTTPELVAALTAIEDPQERAEAALAATEAAAELRAALAQVRRDAFVELNASGKSWTEIGAMFKMSRARAFQVVHGKNR